MKSKISFSLMVCLAVVLCAVTSKAVYYETDYIEYRQPNGVTFIGKEWGDEFAYWWETEDGYRFIKDYQDSYWYYAQLGPDGDFQPSLCKVGIHDPVRCGIPKHLERSLSKRAEIEETRAAFEAESKGYMKEAPPEISLAVLLVEFQDVKHRNWEDHGKRPYTKEEFETMLFSEGVYIGNGVHPDWDWHPIRVYGSMHDYWKEISYGAFNLTGEVLNEADGDGVPNWILLPGTKAEYESGARTFWSNVLSAAQAQGYDVSISDTRKLAAIYAGVWGTSNLWPSASMFQKYKMAERRGESDADPTAWFCNIGTHCHEFGHAGFGLGDLYSGSYAIYHWALMGSGNWNRGWLCNCPAPLNPKYRNQLGWLEFQDIDSYLPGEEIVYNTNTPDVYCRWVNASEYFLVENRQKSLPDFNQGLPAEGLLIWHIRSYIIDLEEADGDGTIDTQGGDTFPGTTENRCFNDFTTPNSNTYAGQLSHFATNRISDSDITMTVDFFIDWSGPDVQLDIAPNPALRGDLITFTVTNNGNQTINLPCIPWVTIKNSDGEVIFPDNVLWLIVPIQPGESQVCVWDQIDKFGNQVGSGFYTVEVWYSIEDVYECPYLLSSQLQILSKGDTNGDGVIDLGDVVYIINYLYRSGPAPDPLWTGDANSDGVVELGDVVYLINYLYREGPPPCSGKAGGSLANASKLSGSLGHAEISLLLKSDPANENWTGFAKASSESFNEVSEISVVGKFDRDVAGVQLEIEFNPNEVELLDPVLTPLTKDLQLFSGIKNGTQKIGIVDLSGKNFLSAGEGTLVNLRAKGKDLTSIKIKKAILVGMDAVPLDLELSGELKFKEIKDSSPLTPDFQESTPQHFSLSQNYPNPFNPQTSIRYALPQDAQVRLIIHNILGQKVKTLVDERQSAGHKTAWWDGKDEKGDHVSSGVYFYRLEAEKFSEVKKMMMVK